MQHTVHKLQCAWCETLKYKRGNGNIEKIRCMKLLRVSAWAELRWLEIFISNKVTSLRLEDLKKRKLQKIWKCWGEIWARKITKKWM